MNWEPSAQCRIFKGEKERMRKGEKKTKKEREIQTLFILCYVFAS